MSVGKRIKKRRLELKLSADKLAEMVGKNRATIYRYESDEIENMPYDVVEPLAKALQTSPAYLMGWEKPSNLIEISQETIKIPVLGKISCGGPLLVEENIVDYRYAVKDNMPSGTTFYLQAKGDSMHPTIPDGSMVLVRHQNDAENGEIVAAMFDDHNEATLKRIRKQGDTIMLLPDNNEHEPIIPTKDNPVRIIGKAIKVERDL